MDESNEYISPRAVEETKPLNPTESEACESAGNEGGSVECFQNYSASEVFIQGLAGLVDQQDVESMIRAQKTMLQRFEKTNEMLSNCNALSDARWKIANQQLKAHKQSLVDIKKDLDSVFKRINQLKAKLRAQHPNIFVELETKEEKIDHEETSEISTDH